jgi:phospholipase/carboxylesterase
MTVLRWWPIRPEAALRGLAAAALAVLAAGCNASPSRPSGSASSVPKPAAAVDLRDDLPFVEVLTGGAAKDAPEPLIVALHGLGDRPESFVGLFREFPVPARVVAPHSRDAFSDGFMWFPPGDPSTDRSAPEMGRTADAIAVFIDHVAKARPTVGKPLIMGFSQGGALSYAVAARHPDAIAASFPVGGWLPAPLWPSKLPQGARPIFAFHGTIDERVPLARGRQAALGLRDLGFDVHFEEIQGVGHAIPDPVREPLFAALAVECDKQRAAPVR